EVEREDRVRRSRAMADGKDDPGRSAAVIAKAERQAAEASERAEVLAAAVDEAMARLDFICSARQEDWQAAATEVVDEAGSALVQAVSAVESAYRDWRLATGQLALATSERSRRKGITISPEAILPVGSDPLTVGAVLAQLAGLPDRRPVDEP